MVVVGDRCSPADGHIAGEEIYEDAVREYFAHFHIYYKNLRGLSIKTLRTFFFSFSFFPRTDFKCFTQK